MTATEELVVVGAENLGFGPGQRGRAKNGAGEIYGEADLSHGPALTELIVEGRGDFLRIVTDEHLRDDAGKITLVGIEKCLRFGCDGIGDALVKEGLLALQEVFLVAEGANGEPGQSKARRNDSEQQNEGNFFHAIRVSCCFPILAVAAVLVKCKVSRKTEGQPRIHTDKHGWKNSTRIFTNFHEFSISHFRWQLSGQRRREPSWICPIP